MILIAAFVLTLLTVPLAGGKLSRITRIKVRGTGWVIAALLIQVFIMNIAAKHLSIDVAEWMHKLSYVLVGGFIWANRRLSGLWIVVLGGSMNLVAIVANGGVMPATGWALETAGRPANDGETFTNSGRADDAKLIVLGDILAWPKPLPLSNVFSIGDVILVIGGGVVLHRTCASKWSKRHMDLDPVEGGEYLTSVIESLDQSRTDVPEPQRGPVGEIAGLYRPVARRSEGVEVPLN
jgi:hypothetical protein